MAKKINEELDLVQNNNPIIEETIQPNTNNAPIVLSDEEKAEKAKREAAATPVVPVTQTATAQTQVKPAPPSTPQKEFIQDVMSDNEGSVSAKAVDYGYQSNRKTGYDIVGVKSAQNAVGKSSTVSGSKTDGTTESIQSTEFDPTKAAKNVQAIDPFLAKVDRDGAAKAFLDVYGEKPSPDALNKAAELARKKNKIAVLSESLRVLFDMGAAVGGGNVYKRDQVQKNIAETKAELNKEEVKYQDALDKFNEGLLGAKGTDLATKRSLMNDAIKAGYSTVGRGKSDQTTVSGSRTNTKQDTRGANQQVVRNQESEYQQRLGLAGAERGDKNTQIISTVVDPKTGQTREQLYTQFNPTEWAAVKPRARMYLAQNPKVIKDAATRYGVSEEIIKKVLAGKYSETDKIGTKNGSISYEDLSDDLVRNFSMQDPRAKAVLDYRRTDQGIDKDNTRTGVVSGTIMDFTDNQQPIDNSGVNIPWQPNAGNPNELLDQLGNE